MTTWEGDKPTGKVRKFQVTITKTATIAIDTSVIAQGVRPDGPIFGPHIGEGKEAEKQVLEHLAFNLVGNQFDLSQLDGYANCPDSSAKVSELDTDVEIDCEVFKNGTRRRL